MKRQNLQILLETGFGGGSLTVFLDQTMLDFRVNDMPGMKSENLLEEIFPILRTNNLTKSDITKVIYSKSNGSQTGLKVGESFAKGLAVGLDIEIEGRDLFEGIIKKFRAENGSGITILPYGKNDLECRYFEHYKFVENPPNRKIRDYFPDEIFLTTAESLTIYTQAALLQDNYKSIFAALSERSLPITDLGDNLSLYLS